jgi:hypothetical protein
MSDGLHPTLHAKRVRRLRKLLRRTPEKRIDLVDFLQTRGYARTAGAARQMLTDGRVTHESHIIGRVQTPYLGADGKVEKRWEPDPLVPASFRKHILVKPT